MKRWMILLVFVLAITGCGGNQAGSDKESPKASEPTDAKTVETAPKDVELSFWVYPRWSGITGKEQDGKLGDFERDAAKRFTEQHPNVTIKIETLDFSNGPQKVNVAIGANETPDILEDANNRLLYYGSLGYLESFDDYLDQDYIREIIPATWEGTTVGDGQHYFIPWGVAPELVLINKTLVDQAGLGDMLPTNEERRWTPEQFKAFAKAFTDKTDIPTVGFFAGSDSGDAHMMNWLWPFGARMYNSTFDKIAFNSPEGLQALDFAKSYLDDGQANPGAAGDTSNDLDNSFVNQGIAVISKATINYSRFKKAMDDKKAQVFDIYATSYPTPENQSLTTTLNTYGFGVFKNKDPEKLKWSMEFAKFMGSKENAAAVKAASSFSVYEDINQSLYSDINDPNIDFARKLLKYAFDPGFATPGYDEIRKMYMGEIQKMFLNKTTPAQTLEAIEKQGNELIEKYKKIMEQQRK